MEQNWKEIDRNMALGSVADQEELIWYDPRNEPFRISGLHWIKTNQSYWRFPEGAFDMLAEKAPGVYFMAKDPAGGQIAFETNARRIVVRAVLEGGQRWDHMAATGEMGMDCYVAYPEEAYCFMGVTRFDAKKNEYMSEVISDCGDDRKRVIINLPLYMPLLQLKIGLPKDATLFAPQPFADSRPIVVYGTSITQGGCVSRPGVMTTNILSRRLNREFLNFGFSGSGKGETEVAELVSMVENPAMFILTYEANAGDLIYQNLVPFISVLRKKHPDTPILVCSRVFCSKFTHNPAKMEPLRQRRLFQKETVEQLRNSGDENVYFVDGWKLMERDCADCFVDGVHPTDLGARQIADAMEPVIRTHLLR